MHHVASYKCVVVGDGMVGKTSMLYSFTQNKIPRDYIPTVFDNHMAHLVYQGLPYGLQLWDTAGQEDYDRLRPLSYPQTDIFLLCFSIEREDSFLNVKKKWAPELDEFDPSIPTILVGTKCDLRMQAKYNKNTPSYSQYGSQIPPERLQDSKGPNLVKAKMGIKLAQSIGAQMYIECSALSQQNLRLVFEHALRICIQRNQMTYSHRKSSRLSRSKSSRRRPVSVLSEAPSSKCTIL